MDLTVRNERESDFTAVDEVNRRAFGSGTEAELVAALRTEPVPLISLVAEQAGRVVGHILFSPVTLARNPELKIMGLAPMAVHPDRQRQGVGIALVNSGLEACRQGGSDAVVVLGHPGYYPRFGFRPASAFGITSEYDVPDDVFMALELLPGAFSGAYGAIRYHEAFDRFS